MILVGLPPDGFRLRFYAADRAEQSYSAVQNPQRTLDFDCKIDMTRSINDIDSMLMPETRSCSARNCNTAFFFLFHPVHGCSAVMHFTDSMKFSRVKQNTLRRRRFSGIDMSHDADISSFF